MKNKFVTFLLSLVIAFGLWMYVVTVVAPDSERTYYDVPVKLHGSDILESRGLTLLSSQDLRLDLELSGNRTDLNQLSSSNITIIADLTGINSAGEHTISYDVSYPGSISSGITILSPEKQTITVVVAEWTKKEIPIEVDYEGKLEEGYYVESDPILSRSTVTVSGVKEVVDRIEKANITIDLNGRTENIDQIFDLSFRDKDGHPVELVNAMADAERVTAVVKINMTRTLNVEVSVIPGGGLAEEDATWVSSIEQLVVAGPASVVEEMEDFHFTIDLAGVEMSKTLFFDITLPSGVTNVDEIWQVAVDVTVPAVKTQTHSISAHKWEFINLPEGVEMTVGTQMIAVQIRGREHHLEQVGQENIKITIDLTNATIGSHSYQVTVEIVGVDEVEVIGTYTVTVILAEKTPPDGPPVEEPEE